jgi:predicted DNA-binding transcriptional regulator AlpA
MADSLMSMNEVLEVVPVGRSTLYRMMNSGGFPRSVPISQNRRGWYRSEVDAWIESLRNNEPEAING